MRLHNAEKAVVDAAKVRDYLLSAEHPVGRFKCTFFQSLGYERARWQSLERDLLSLAVAGDAEEASPSSFGRKYRVAGRLTGPNGRSASIASVWIVRRGESAPRLVTAYPTPTP